MALACAVLGISGFVLSFISSVPEWVSIALYIAAMVTGGWDAAVDVRKGLPKGELDIHFLMLAVPVGASSIGAWAEGALLLFLFSFSKLTFKQLKSQSIEADFFLITDNSNF